MKYCQDLVIKLIWICLVWKGMNRNNNRSYVEIQFCDFFNFFMMLFIINGLGILVKKVVGFRVKVIVVLGVQWGDEGKGKLVDILVIDVDFVCWCQVRFVFL